MAAPQRALLRRAMTLSAIIVLLASLSGCASRRVAMPPLDASPEQVVQTYLEAQQAHDCQTSQSLRSASMQPPRQPGKCNFLNLTEFRIIKSQPDRAGLFHDEHPLHQRIYVDLELGWGAEDHGFHRGTNPWSYILDRGARGAPWRIIAQGMG